MLTFEQKGKFKKTDDFFHKLLRLDIDSILEDYAKKGLDALRSATPVDTGLTASSWYYNISRTEDNITISYWNSNINKGVPIAIILQYGHATNNGGWVEGRDYINPAIQPIFDELANKIWKEVTK